MKGFKGSFNVLAAVGCLLTAGNAAADQCAFISQEQAKKAFEILTNRKTIVDWCEPCGENASGRPYAVNTVEIIPQGESREISVNGKPIDLAYVFVRKASSNTYENLAALVDCPASGVSRSVTVSDDAAAVKAAQMAAGAAQAQAAQAQAAQAAQAQAATAAATQAQAATPATPTTAEEAQATAQAAQMAAALAAAQAALAEATAATAAATPVDADGYYERGMTHYNQKNYKKAIADFSKAISLHPKAAEYYRWRGFAYDETGEYDKTIADYTEVIRLEPKSAMNYFNRGLAYNKKEDFASAAADFTKALKFTPGDADYLLNRGIAYGNNGEYQLAIADMEIAKSKYPKEFNMPDSLLSVYKAALASPQNKRGKPVVGYAGTKKSALTYEYEAAGTKTRGAVYFYREGNKINDGVLRVFDSQSNLVKRINISDRTQGGQNRRAVGTWDITNLNGKPARQGTYSVTGTVTTRDGRSEDVSLTVDIRQ